MGPADENLIVSAPALMRDLIADPRDAFQVRAARARPKTSPCTGPTFKSANISLPATCAERLEEHAQKCDCVHVIACLASFFSGQSEVRCFDRARSVCASLCRAHASGKPEENIHAVTSTYGHPGLSEKNHGTTLHCCAGISRVAVTVPCCLSSEMRSEPELVQRTRNRTHCIQQRDMLVWRFL